MEKSSLFLQDGARSAWPTQTTMSNAPTYSLNDLAEATGITTHMIRHWMRNGHLPPTVPRGPNTKYEEQHRLWIKAIVLATKRGMSLRNAAAHVRALEFQEDLEEAAGEPKAAPAPPPSPVAPPPAPTSPARDALAAERRVWEHVPICPGVELHVRIDADVEARKIALLIEQTFGNGAPKASR
jgi:DNA-binding transcriptional MerR regulator